MKSWFRGRGTPLVVFLAIAALDLETRSWQNDFEHELNAQISLALWRLDSRVAPALAREDSRPFNHYSAFFAPAVAFNSRGERLPAGDVLEPSPLINADLPN